MTHPLVLGLFDTPADAATAARALRVLGLPRERVSIVARNHDEEGELATASGGSPGSEIEDSRIASRLLARTSLYPGLAEIVTDIVSGGKGSELYRVAIPDECVGLSLDELSIRLRSDHSATLRQFVTFLSSFSCNLA